MVDKTRKKGTKCATTNASVIQANREIRQETLREQLAASNLIDRINREEEKLDILFNTVSRLKDGNGYALRKVHVKLVVVSKKMDSLYRKLNKVLPDLKSMGVEARLQMEQITPQDRIDAVAYGLGVQEFVERRAEGTLPPKRDLSRFGNVYQIERQDEDKD